MSIGTAQAKALADNFLDDLGDSKDDFVPRETLSEIIILAGDLIDNAQNNLNRSNKIASGELSASLIANDPTQNGTVFSVDIEMLYYGKFVNAGVKGTKGGHSTAGYSFKYDLPSKKMVDAIRAWIKNAKASTTNVKKAFRKNETKKVSIAQADKAYAIARSILQKGLVPTGFLDKAIDTTKNKARDSLGLALRADVIDSIMP